MFIKMGKMYLLSERLKWAVQQKEIRENMKISHSDLSRVVKKSRASVTNWYKDTTKISAESARPLADYLGVNAVWLETGDGEPTNKNGKERFASLLSDKEPLNEMAKQLNEMFVKVPQDDRDLIISLANRLYVHNFPHETHASGKKVKPKVTQ
jgi:transcriptional regulator with XRE-family HTH domain